MIRGKAKIRTEMKLLLTNDDGIDSPGLAALQQAAVLLGDAIVVAPLEAHSGCSHRVTTGKPIRVDRRKADRFAVDGTPADCVRVALHGLAGDIAASIYGENSMLATDIITCLGEAFSVCDDEATSKFAYLQR